LSNVYCVLNASNNVKLNKNNSIIEDTLGEDSTILDDPNINNICTVEMSSGDFTTTNVDYMQITEEDSPKSLDDVSISQTAPPFRIACEFCGKEFAFASDLRRHTRSHTGEKPFECGLCSFKTSQKYNLERHNKKVHKQETNKEFITK